MGSRLGPIFMPTNEKKGTPVNTELAIALCTNIQNEQQLKDEVASCLAVEEDCCDSMANYSESVITEMLFENIATKLCDGKIKCYVYLTEKGPRFHLNHLELVRHKHHVTILLAGALDPATSDVSKYVTNLARRICSKLKCYSPSLAICSAVVFALEKTIIRQCSYTIDSKKNITKTDGNDKSAMHSNALGVASAWWEETAKR